MNWEAFAAAAPELASVGDKRFEATGLCLMGTLRRDGFPRISPVEPYLVEGELLLGMMHRSLKALDLLRDPRLTIMTAQCDREAAGGDLKLYGRAVDVGDADMRIAYGDATEARIDWRPDEPFHLFSVDVESAGYITFGDNPVAIRWSAGDTVGRIRHPDAGS